MNCKHCGLPVLFSFEYSRWFHNASTWQIVMAGDCAEAAV